MLELAEGDETFASEIRSEIERLETSLDELELKSLLSGPHDSAVRGSSASNARDGGTDGQRLGRDAPADVHGLGPEKPITTWSFWSAKTTNRRGIQSATIAIPRTHGLRLFERRGGHHRLVRISPYNAGSQAGRRVFGRVGCFRPSQRRH